jgi:hypothetical protein
MKLPAIKVKRWPNRVRPTLYISGVPVPFNDDLDGCRLKYIDPQKRFIVKVEIGRKDTGYELHHDEAAFYSRVKASDSKYFPKLLKCNTKNRWSVHEFVLLDQNATPSMKEKKIVKKLVKAYALNDIEHKYCRNWAMNISTNKPCIYDPAFNEESDSTSYSWPA